MSVVDRNNRRAIDKKLTGDLTEAQWYESLDYFEDRCAYCNTKLVKVTVNRPKKHKNINKKKKVRHTPDYRLRTLEHIEPLGQKDKQGNHTSAGTTSFNVIPACDRCNNNKGEKELIDWYSKQEYFTEDNLDRIIDYRTQKNPDLDIKNYTVDQENELQQEEL